MELNLLLDIPSKNASNKPDDGVDKNNYTCAAWIISSCDEYSPEVRQAAFQQSVQNSSLPIRLINGGEFAKMLIDVGFSDFKFEK